MSNRNSNYLRLLAEKSRCPVCERQVTLIQHKNPSYKPMFYICWYCKQAWEVGVGRIVEEL